MAHCININSIDFKELKKQTGLTETILKTKISVWQDKHGIDRFPTKDEIYATMQLQHRVGLYKKEVSNLEKNLVIQRITAYNKKNPPIYIDFTRVGQSDLYTWKVRDNIFYQENNENKETEEKENPGSVANENLINTITASAKSMGINIITLEEYAKGNPSIDVTNINGIADLTQKTIAIAEGMESVTLTEEVVHMATAIMEQTNPRLVTEMISKIDRFQIYKKVFDEYKNLKPYQLSSGNPDIRKIKKEAVDKLIAEVLINHGQDEQQFPEFREIENVNWAKRMWQAIVDAIKGIYRKSDIDVFKFVGSNILTGEPGSVEDIQTTGIYAQVASTNASVEALFNTIIQQDQSMVLRTVEEGYERRHYAIKNADGTFTEIKQSVTEKVEKISQGRFAQPKRTGQDLINDESKKLWGTHGHNYIMDYINTNLIDKVTGFAKIASDEKIITELDDAIVPILQDFCKNLIGRYAPGTKFIVERQVVNGKKDLASTIDFMAIEPIKNKDGSDGYRVDILDWKFTTVNLEVTDDIPWFKQNSWKMQMNEYAKMLTEYGMKPTDLRKARMVPFIVDYVQFADDPKEGLYASSVEVGDLDNLETTQSYLLPVPIRTESTGNEALDSLISALFAHYDKLNLREASSAVQKYAKAERLNALSSAIRKLQVTLNFSPLVDVGYTFLKSAKATIASLENIDYSSLSKEEINKKLGDLLSVQNSSKKFIDIDKVMLKTYTEGLSDAQVVTMEQLGKLSLEVSLLEKRIRDLQGQLAMQIGVESGFVSEANAEVLLAPEKAIGFMAKTFLEGTKLSAKLVRLGSNLLLRAASLVDITYIKEMNSFKSVLIPLEKVAQSMGVDAFSLIGTIKSDGLELIEKLDPKFIEDIKEARSNKNKKFILDNIHLDEFNKDVDDLMEKQIAVLKDMVFDANDPANDDWIRTIRIGKMRNSIDINRKTFNGWTDHNFVNLVNKHLNQGLHHSPEYTQMAKTKEALAMWEHFTAWNNKAMDMGYLSRKKQAFLPLIEATTIQKFSATENHGKELMDFFKDLKTVKIDEAKSYAKIDPETHEVLQSIPTYFTATDQKVEKLSKDLGKIGALYAKALLDYESSVNMENIMLTLYEVEKSKGSVNTDEAGNVIRTGRGLEKNTKTPNAPIFKAIIDDSVYGISESADGVDLSPNTRKAIENANTWTRSLGVGMKYMLGIANYFGYNFQSFIQAGGAYRYREFFRNNSDITLNRLSTEQRALMDMISPLGENVVTEKRREFSKEYSYKAYLNTWTFSDLMHITNSFPDRLLQMANAASFNENTMVVNGALVNIRDYVRAEDRRNRKNLSFDERKALEATQQERIDTLKETKSLLKTVIVTEQGASIPGVSDEELAKYRVRVLDYGRSLNGQMDPDNKAAYRRNIIFRGFMMFRTWIPKLVHTRIQDINYNAEQDNWEYGRMRLWGETVMKVGLGSVWKMQHIILNTEEGMKIMDEMLEEKREKYLEATGQVLEITNEEYYDLVHLELSRQVKELRLLFAVIATTLAAKAAAPPDDASELERNKYKYWYKLTSKVSDELSFYYSPGTFQEVTKGNILPAMGLMTSVTKFFSQFGQEMYGYSINDQEMINSKHPLKYFLNLMPVGSQFQTDWLPLIDPELAKENGIKVTAVARSN